MSSPTKPRTPRLYHASARTPETALDPGTALAVAACAISGFYAVVMFIPFDIAIYAGQPVMALIAISLVVGLREPHPARRLGYGLPHPRFLAAAVLIGVSAWYLNARIMAQLDPPTTEVHKLEEMVEKPPLLGALFAIGVLPGLCEELVFRGVVARGLATRVPPILAILASAALFSLYHHSLTQALPTFTLGLALGIVAIRADSAIPTMLAHFLNNALAILLIRSLPGVAAAINDNPTPTLAGALALLAGGIVLAVR